MSTKKERRSKNEDPSGGKTCTLEKIQKKSWDGCGGLVWRRIGNERREKTGQIKRLQRKRSVTGSTCAGLVGAGEFSAAASDRSSATNSIRKRNTNAGWGTWTWESVGPGESPSSPRLEGDIDKESSPRRRGKEGGGREGGGYWKREGVGEEGRMMVGEEGGVQSLFARSLFVGFAILFRSRRGPPDRLPTSAEEISQARKREKKGPKKKKAGVSNGDPCEDTRVIKGGLENERGRRKKAL